VSISSRKGGISDFLCWTWGGLLCSHLWFCLFSDCLSLPFQSCHFQLNPWIGFLEQYRFFQKVRLLKLFRLNPFSLQLQTLLGFPDCGLEGRCFHIPFLSGIQWRTRHLKWNHQRSYHCHNIFPCSDRWFFCRIWMRIFHSFSVLWPIVSVSHFYHLKEVYFHPCL